MQQDYLLTALPGPRLEEQKLGLVLEEVDVDFMLDVMPNSGVNLNFELERTVPK